MTNIDRLLDAAPVFRERLAHHKGIPVNFPFYRYDTLNMLRHVRDLMPPHRREDMFGAGARIADVGCGDGDLGLFLSGQGFDVDLYDWPGTNLNGMQAAYFLKNELASSARLFHADLDNRFDLAETYNIVLFFGVLYHLKNPFYVLEQLARRTLWMFLSTKIIRTFGEGLPTVTQPAAYLVAPRECNGDATNYWMFTEAGLRRILDRAGWEVVSYTDTGVEDSNPQTIDERAFVFARSRH
jgi:tRNA (mo5U34)-methyltransferase